MKWKTIAYTTRSGKTPIEEYLSTLDVKQQAKISRSLSLLEEFGLDWGEPAIKYLENGIYELRIRLSNNQFRVMMFHLLGNKIILLNGFTKKEQKTPRKEIERAKQYRADFLDRAQKGEIKL